MENELTLGRVLQIWRYGVSHSQLVLLAVPTNEDKRRTTILLKGVGEIFLPTAFFCDKVTWPESEDDKVISFHSNGVVYYVQALAIYSETDELDYNDPLPLIDESMF